MEADNDSDACLREHNQHFQRQSPPEISFASSDSNRFIAITKGMSACVNHKQHESVNLKKLQVSGPFGKYAILLFSKTEKATR